ncbi:hypothetical protein DL93DRAFT_1236491 [Clavulina sp. PMI_390]|nr:hypothetical protein DL93DRAFT_1236491 [Clavulina sp. PMI_390]
MGVTIVAKQRAQRRSKARGHCVHHRGGGSSGGGRVRGGGGGGGRVVCSFEVIGGHGRWSLISGLARNLRSILSLDQEKKGKHSPLYPIPPIYAFMALILRPVDIIPTVNIASVAWSCGGYGQTAAVREYIKSHLAGGKVDRVELLTVFRTGPRP